MRRLGYALPLAALLAGSLAGAQEDASSGPERRVTKLLDSVVQPRFQILDPIRGFGLRRVAPMPVAGRPVRTTEIHGHAKLLGGVLKPENDQERAFLTEVKALNCQYVLGFLHLGYRLDRETGRHTGSTKPAFEYVGEVDTSLQEGREVLQAALGEKVRLLKRGNPLELEHAHWQVSVRPVKAVGNQCASCHAGVNAGQVMGAMVYFVKRTTPEKPQ